MSELCIHCDKPIDNPDQLYLTAHEPPNPWHKQCVQDWFDEFFSD